MKYSEIARQLNLYISKNQDADTLAYITHYLQTFGYPAASYYSEKALPHIPKNIDLNNIEWDIPFKGNENPTFSFIDLFAGIGGTRIAFENLGGKCVFSSEIDYYAKQSYQFNYGEVPFGDITKIDETSIPDHDILVGGFPCQAFSIAGRRGGFEDTRGTLFFEIARILREKRPKAFFLENVKGLLSHDRGRTINVILNTLREDLGYYVPDPQIINASDFGVPQKRERIYIVGFRNDLNIHAFSYPKPLDIITSFADVKEQKPVSSKFYLSEAMLETLRNHRYRHASAGNGFGYTVIDDEEHANALVTGGMGKERNLIIDKRLTDYTPVTHIKGEINRDGIRRMTPREWARLQGFPEHFEIKVSDTQAYKQFGNSVAIPAVQATGEQLIYALKSANAFNTDQQPIVEQSKNVQTNTDINFKKYTSTKGELGMFKLNKGEWSEIYTILKLLADGKLHAADSDLNKIENIYYPLIKIFRSEFINTQVQNYEYLYNNTEAQITCRDDITIRILDGNDRTTLLEMPVLEFKEKSLSLLNEIKTRTGSAFAITPELENFLNSIFITKKSMDSSDKKRDITIVVHDLITGFEPTLGFSIKSKLGSAATLLNASGATNFTFKFTGKDLLSEAEIERINNTYSSTYERIIELEKLGFNLEFKNLDNTIFNANLQLIDSQFPSIMAELVKYYYRKDTSSASVKDLLTHIKEKNPCNFVANDSHPFYEFKMKRFIVDVALGMKPTEIWEGQYDANGGYIVVKKDGELVCYHVYNHNEFENYLIKNTKFEAASRNRHDFGYIYRDNEDLLIKLNLQIRFVN